ncbi:TIGR02391 family protein [Paraburkholderia rhizosphaerae]|nr:TIGR02391 family protein [Paraburkholderia rhizosphaerae]
MDSKTYSWFMRACEKLDEIQRECVKWADAPSNVFQGSRRFAWSLGYQDVSKLFDDFLDIWHERMRPYKWSKETMRLVRFEHQRDYHSFIFVEIAKLREAARLELDTHSDGRSDPNIPLFDLLHPIIANRAWDLYTAAHYRAAVETSITAVFDYIRVRADLQLDGQQLVTEAFKLEGGRLVVSTLETESGRNEQKGFINILTGAYQAIRNPLAHSTIHRLWQKEAAEHLVFASLLARTVDHATGVDQLPSEV